MDKKGKKDVNQNKNKIIPKIIKKNNLKKEKTVTTILKDSKKIVQKSKENLKSKNIKKINNSSKKYSMDNRETIPNTNSNINSNPNTNNITDSTEILLDKKKILKTEIYNKKINLKTKYNKNSEEKIEKNITLNNKDYNINPFLIKKKNNNNNTKININSTTKDKDKDKEDNSSNKKEEKISNIDNVKRPTYNKNNINLMEFSFDKNFVNNIEVKDKDAMYKNRFFTKIIKSKNNSKERKSEGSFGSIIHQKKLKLFSFANDQQNNSNNNLNINMKDSAIGPISSKNIIHEQNSKENKMMTEIKDGLKNVPEKKMQASGKKKNIIEKKISHRKINRYVKNNNKNGLDSNNSHKETKEILKLETKINKNREILFNSKGKIPKEKIREKNKNTFQLLFPKIKAKSYNSNFVDSNSNTTKNSQRTNNTITKIINEKRVTYNPLHHSHNIGNKTFNSPKNKKKLINSNSSLSKNKFEDKTSSKDLNKVKNKDKDKPEKIEKAINFKKNISPTKINIDLEEKTINNEYLDKPLILSSERYSSINQEPSLYSILKDNITNNKNEENIYSMEALYLNNKFNSMNKSPQIKRKIDNNNNKILRTKTEIYDASGKSKTLNKINNDPNKKSNDINVNINLNFDKSNVKENLKNKNSKNQKLNEDVFMQLNTLDNESFKKSTVKKLIKNNQYKALLSEMATVNLNKDKDKDRDKERDKDKNKEKEHLKNKKKYRFSERRRGSHLEEPNRKLTESSENYYNLYKKAFNDNNNLEQKFSFRPKSKNKDLYNNYNNKNNDIEDDKILNKKVSTISFTSKQKQLLDNEINMKELSYNKKNGLSNSLEENKIYNKEEENENDNKNFILDLNHFIPIDENKLIDTFSIPLFGNEK